MARLRQQHPQDYVSSSRINAEIENIIRYLNAAEIGNKTVGELLDSIFNDEGEFDGAVELRLDPTVGLQYRVGEYDLPEEGWKTIADIADLRGPAGVNVGTVEGPFFYNRQDYTATQGQTEFDYTFDESTDTVMVWVNGLLQPEDAYTTSPADELVTFNSGLTEEDAVTILSVRTQSVTNFRRVDYEAAPGQVVYSFPHTEDETIVVFQNGVFLRQGGSYDYTTSPDSDTVTLMHTPTTGDLITIMTVENKALTNVGGLMLEDEYTDANGLIRYNKLSIADGEIPQSKVDGLVARLENGAILVVSPSTPSDPETGWLWLDTSTNPNRLKFYDGAGWLLTSPESTLPTFTSAQANYYVRVNGTGTALEYGTIDFSSLVPKTYIGAADGVASLDNSGRIPEGQLPEILTPQMLQVAVGGDVENGTYLVQRIFKEKVRIYGLTGQLSTGTCSVQLSVDGSPVGTVYGMSDTAEDATFGAAVEVDGTTVSKRVEIVVTSASGSKDLEVALAAKTVIE